MFERLDPPEEFRPDEGFRSAVVTRGRRLRRRRHRIAGAALGTVVVMAAVVGVTAGWSRRQWDDVERVEVQQSPRPSSPRRRAVQRARGRRRRTAGRRTGGDGSAHRLDHGGAGRARGAPGAGRVHPPGRVGADRGSGPGGPHQQALGAGRPGRPGRHRRGGARHPDRPLPAGRLRRLPRAGRRGRRCPARCGPVRCATRPPGSSSAPGARPSTARDALALVRSRHVEWESTGAGTTTRPATSGGTSGSTCSVGRSWWHSATSGRIPSSEHVCSTCSRTT